MKPRHDALLVLPRENENGLPDEEGRSRVRLAVGFFERGYAPILLMQGLHTSNPDLIDRKTTLARAMQDYAVSQLNVDSSNILREEHSVDTVGHAVLGAAYFLARRGWKNIGVVTSGYHMIRAEPIFREVVGERARMSFYPDSFGLDNPGIRDRELGKVDVFRETFEGIKSGDIDAFVRRLYEAHPLYVGKNPNGALPK